MGFRYWDRRGNKGVGVTKGFSMGFWYWGCRLWLYGSWDVLCKFSAFWIAVPVAIREVIVRRTRSRGKPRIHKFSQCWHFWAGGRARHGVCHEGRNVRGGGKGRGRITRFWGLRITPIFIGGLSYDGGRFGVITGFGLDRLVFRGFGGNGVNRA